MRVVLRMLGTMGRSSRLGGTPLDQIQEFDLGELHGLALWIESDDGRMRRVVAEGNLADFRPEGTE